MPLEETCSCIGALEKTGLEVRFKEDIPLPQITENYRHLLATKYQIEKGRCRLCRQTKVAKDYNLGGQKVVIGENVQLLICTLVARGSTYSCVIDLLKLLYGLQISSGEIAAIIKRKSAQWQRANQTILQMIRSGSVVHMDESGWRIREEEGRGQGWVASATNGLVHFALKKSRGKVHALEILKDFDGLRVTDDYAAYSSKELKGDHQLCWIHLIRPAKETFCNKHLPQEQRDYAGKLYGGLCSLQADLQKALDRPADLETRYKQKAEFEKRLKLLLSLDPGLAGSPKRLSKLEQQLLRALAATNSLAV